MGKELIVMEPVIEPEILVPAVRLSAAAANDEAGDDPFCEIVDAEEFEAGIASVFGSLRADIESGANDDQAPMVIEPLELEPADLLLAELNRLWAQPLAA